MAGSIPRRRPTLMVGGRELIVGCAEQAVLHLCDRTASNWQTDAYSGDAFVYVENCV